MTIAWALMLTGFVVAIVGFETFALATGRRTLSQFVWSITSVFPLFPFIVGLLVGGLAVHFWWGGVVCFTSATS